SDSSSQKLVKFLFLDQNRRGKIETKGRAYGYSVRCIKALKGETPPVISGGSGKTPSSGSGNAPSDDRDNSMATATPIGPNGTTQGRIDRAGDRDWFKIVIPSTGTLVVKTTGETDTIGSLYDVSGRRQIAYDDDGGTGRNFKMTQTVTAGTYYVEVEHRSISETGSYVFVSQFIADDHSNTKGKATAINLNTTTPGNIEVAGDKDWFKIVIPSTGTLVVNTTGATDTKGALLSENGVQVASDDNSGASDNFKITKAITVVGTYYIKIKHHSPTGTGNYSLATMFTPGRVEQAKSLDDYGDTNATARTISPTSTTSGSLEVAGDIDYFKIVIPSTGTLVVKTAGFTDTNGSLLDASNTPIATDHNSGSERNFEISTFIQHAGTYYVMVKHLSPEATGNYVLVSEFTPDDHGSVRSLATVISPNSVTAGNIGSAGDEDWFKIVLPNDG
ncbi:MAG: hypothetical protein LGB06_08110, partial [Sulfurovum sp.]|nr:hypothetical protein [Sulfurovum sp.]